MSTRKIKDAVDLSTGEKVYYKSHAKATYMSDGRTVEDAIKTAGGGGGMAVIDHGTEDTTFELTPNVIHKWGIVPSLTLSIPKDSDGSVNQFKAVFTTGSDFTLSLPNTIRWMNLETPTFLSNYQYELSIQDGRIAYAVFEKQFDNGQFLTYIESDGQDYILTDIYIDSNIYGVSCKSAPLFDGATKSGAVAGVNNKSGSSNMPFALYYGSSDYKFGWNGSIVSEGTFGNGIVKTIEKRNTQITLSASFPLCIFGLNIEGTITYNELPQRLYRLQFFDVDGNAIIDLRPFERMSDGAIGLIDYVSGKFYESALGVMVGE